MSETPYHNVLAPDWNRHKDDDDVHWTQEVPQIIQEIWATFTDEQKVKIAGWAGALTFKKRYYGQEKMMRDFKQGDLVWIRRLGGKLHKEQYFGKVCGLSIDGVMKFYIVEVCAGSTIPGQGDWTHVTVPASCLDRAEI